MKAPGDDAAPVAYRVSQVAAMLNLPVSTVYDLVRRRAMEAVRIGEGRKKLTLITASALQDFLRRNTVPARTRVGAQATDRRLER
jgi:excisionase family DNA binding protein